MSHMSGRFPKCPICPRCVRCSPDVNLASAWSAVFGGYSQIKCPPRYVVNTIAYSFFCCPKTQFKFCRETWYKQLFGWSKMTVFQWLSGCWQAPGRALPLHPIAWPPNHSTQLAYAQHKPVSPVCHHYIIWSSISRYDVMHQNVVNPVVNCCLGARWTWFTICRESCRTQFSGVPKKSGLNFIVNVTHHSYNWPFFQSGQSF